jgi:GT2 family glycosyltransferase
MSSKETEEGALLSIIQVTYNSENVIENCLDALAGLENSEIIIVDNNSVDSTCAKILSGYPQVQLVARDENLGFAASSNAGAFLARGKYLLLLNPDAQITQAEINKALDFLERNPDVGILGPYTDEGSGSFKTLAAGYFPGLKNVFTHAFGLSRFSKKFSWLRGHYLLKDQTDRGASLDVDWVSGACMFVRHEVWKELEGLSRRWFMYAEDVDFCFRVKRLGFRVVYGAGVLAKHEVGGSSGSSGGIGTLWLENLLDFYEQKISKNWITTLVWKSIVSAGYWLRAAVLLIHTNKQQRQSSRRFSMYAKSLWKIKPKSHKAKYYPVARTVHLERISVTPDTELLFTNTRADWDLSLYSSLRNVKRVSLARVMWRILTGPRLCLEVAEPLAFSSAISLLLLSLSANIRNLFPGVGETKFVTYCIENLDPVEKIQSKFNLPKSLAGLMVSLYVRVISKNIIRMAFGTNAALENYRRIIGEDKFAQGEKVGKYEYFSPFLPAAPDLDLNYRQSNRFGFVGPLEKYKGFDNVIEAWALVKELYPNATLDIYTPSAPREEILERLIKDDRINVFVRSPRDKILAAYSSFHVLLLPSRSTSTWKEQIGLPIIEGLSHGCEIVATAETGISQWLVDNGHQVLDSDYSTADLVDAMSKAIAAKRSKREVVQFLPLRDGRLVADEWMFHGE